MTLTKTPKRDKRRVWLDEKDCERMTRTELEGLKWLIAMDYVCASVGRDLRKRLESIPYGKERMRLASGGIRSIASDLIGTITKEQARVLQSTTKDYVVRLAPKAAPLGSNVLLDRESLVKLAECAREKCRICTEDGESCRECELYKFLEATTPLDDYGNGLLCPYTLKDWK